MYKCWERYGKKSLKPKLVEQDLRLFVNTETIIETFDDVQHIMVFIPLIWLSHHEGLPTLIEASHRNKNKDNTQNKGFSPTLWPGQALMFNAQLKSRLPKAGGGVLLTRVYDVTGL